MVGMSLPNGAALVVSSISISINQSIRFDENGSEIGSNGAEALRQVAIAVRSSTVETLRVECHADPSERKVVAVANARALAVKRWLSSEGGLDAARIVAVGHGATRPIASSRTPRGRQENRRCDVIPSPRSSEAPFP